MLCLMYFDLCCSPKLPYIILILLCLPFDTYVNGRHNKIKIMGSQWRTSINKIIKHSVLSLTNKNTVKSFSSVGHSDVLLRLLSGHFYTRIYRGYGFYIRTNEHSHRSLLFADVHRCFPLFEFLFWLAQSFMTCGRQTKSKKCESVPSEQRK